MLTYCSSQNEVGSQYAVQIVAGISGHMWKNDGGTEHGRAHDRYAELNATIVDW